MLCPDLPGRGASDRLPDPAMYIPPTYVAALSHLLARLDGPVDWVGTSLGGICGMVVAATPGHPVRRLVLNDIGAFVPKESLARIGDYLGEVGDFADMPALEQYLRPVHAPFGALSDAEWRHLAETSSRARGGRAGGIALRPGDRRAVPRRRAGGHGPLADLDAGHSAGAACIRGAESDLLSAETAQAMAPRPGVRMAEIPGCGHAPALMDPTRSAWCRIPVGRLVCDRQNRQGRRAEYFPPLCVPACMVPSIPARPGSAARLQTLRALRWPVRRSLPPGHRLWLPLADGDALAAMLHFPETPRRPAAGGAGARPGRHRGRSLSAGGRARACCGAASRCCG